VGPPRGPPSKSHSVDGFPQNLLVLPGAGPRDGRVLLRIRLPAFRKRNRREEVERREGSAYHLLAKGSGWFHLLVNSHYPLLVGPENEKAFSESSRYAQNLFPEKGGCFPFGITVPNETGKQSTFHTLCGEPPVRSPGAAFSRGPAPLV
jgi:hypothetical protein